MKQLDVPDENLVELRAEQREEVVEKDLKSWLIQDAWRGVSWSYCEFNLLCMTFGLEQSSFAKVELGA